VNKGTLSQEDLRRLLDAVDGRAACIIRTMLDSGLRRLELVGLDWADADLVVGIVAV